MASTAASRSGFGLHLRLCSPPGIHAVQNLLETVGLRFELGPFGLGLAGLDRVGIVYWAPRHFFSPQRSADDFADAVAGDADARRRAGTG